MVEREMKEVLGRTLAVLDRVPDELLEADWRLLRRALVGDSLIPSRYQALIGVAVARPSGAPMPPGCTRNWPGCTGRARPRWPRRSTSPAAIRLEHAMHGFGFDAGEFEAEVADIATHIAGRLAVD